MATLEISKPIPLATVVRNTLLNALAYTEGNQTKAAAHLGISSRVMHYAMARNGIPTAKTSRVRPATLRERALAKLTMIDRKALGLE